MRNIFLGCIILGWLSGSLFAQNDRVAEDYIIGEEDVLAVSVWREPDLSVPEMVVRHDGKISVPLINDIVASGKTTSQLKETITEKLREFVEDPHVSVIIIRGYSNNVTVVGQVNKPQLYALGSPTTVLDILSRAGGLTGLAKEKNIQILRIENGMTIKFPFNYKNVIRGKDLYQNILLKAGDTILVP